MRKGIVRWCGVAILLVAMVAMAAGAEKARSDYAFTCWIAVPGWPTDYKWGEDEVSKFLKEKFKITYTLTAAQTDARQELNLMVASDDLPDAIQFNWGDDGFNDFINVAKAGKLVPLDKYLAKYGQYNSIIEKAVRDLCAIDGKHYDIQNWATNKEYPVANAGWVYNKSIIKTVGGTAPTTIDEVTALLKKVKAANLVVSNKPVVPLQLGEVTTAGMTGGYYMILASFGCNVYDDVYTEGYTVPFFKKPNYNVPASAKLKLCLTSPALVNAVVYLNMLWREGLIPKDYFTLTHEQIRENLSNGQAAMYTNTDIVGAIGGEARPAMLQVQPDNDYVGFVAPAGPGVKPGEVRNWWAPKTGAPMTVTAKAKEPERIVELWDYLFSNEGSRIANWGPPGTLYSQWDKNQIPTDTASFKQLSALTFEEGRKLGLGLWTWPGNYAYAARGIYETYLKQPADKKDWLMDVYVKYCSPSPWDVSPMFRILPTSDSPEGIIWKTVDDMLLAAMPKFVQADSEAACRQLIKDTADQAYKAGFAKVETYMTAIWKANVKKMK
jgi:putative aldouronate transport system substrate-binding protein